MSTLPSVEVCEVGGRGVQVEVVTDDAEVVLWVRAKSPESLGAGLEWVTESLIPTNPVRHHRLVMLAAKAERLALEDPDVVEAMKDGGLIPT